LSDTNRTFRGFRNHYRTLGIRDRGQYIDHLAQTIVPEGNLDGLRSLLVRLLPQGILREASSRNATLRFLGKSEDGLDALSYVRPSGELLTLSFDAQTHLLSRTETLRADTIDGDIAVVTRRWSWQAWRPTFTSSASFPMDTACCASSFRTTWSWSRRPKAT
jgi:hypothetical protein